MAQLLKDVEFIEKNQQSSQRSRVVLSCIASLRTVHFRGAREAWGDFEVEPLEGHGIDRLDAECAVGMEHPLTHCASPFDDARDGGVRDEEGVHKVAREWKLHVVAEVIASQKAHGAGLWFGQLLQIHREREAVGSFDSEFIGRDAHVECRLEHILAHCAVGDEVLARDACPVRVSVDSVENEALEFDERCPLQSRQRHVGRAERGGPFEAAVEEVKQERKHKAVSEHRVVCKIDPVPTHIGHVIGKLRRQEVFPCHSPPRHGERRCICDVRDHGLTLHVRCWCHLYDGAERDCDGGIDEVDRLHWCAGRFAA